MVRDTIKTLQAIGRMEEANMDQYIDQLNKIERPVSAEEAKVLVSLFPDQYCYGVDWTLLHLMETAWSELGRDGYKELIELCVSDCWKHEMRIRLGD